MNPHHIAIYNGKEVVMDYVPKERQFKLACMRIIDNGFDGFVVTPEGERYEVRREWRSAKLVTQAE